MGSSKGGDSVIGYKYYLGMHVAICHGPVDAIEKIIVGERLAKEGGMVYVPGTPVISTTLDAPLLFGGEKKEGGIQGEMDVMFGADDQPQNSYLQTHLGAVIPAFKGVVSRVLKSCYVSAMSPYPKKQWDQIRNVYSFNNHWYDATANVVSGGVDGSANGAHIVRESLINPDWGLGYPTTMVSDSDFRAVADTLFAENFGLSFLLSGEGSCENFIQEVLKTVNGVIYTDRKTGVFRIKLIRDDYVSGDLPVFDENNIIKYKSFQRAQPAELVNEVVIVYRKKGDSKDTSATYQDLASVQSQGAIISQKLEYPGVDSDDIAGRVGLRELKQRSTPISQVVFTANRDAWALNPGDPFIFKREEIGIMSLVMRVVKIDYGDLLNGQITIDAVEDVFGLPDASYSKPQTPIWEDPVQNPESLEANTTAEFELPYYNLAVRLGAAAETLPEDVGFLVSGATAPVFTSPSYQLNTSLTGVVSDYSFKSTGNYIPYVSLMENITYTDNNVDINVSEFPPRFAESVVVGSLAIINNEIVRVLAFYTETSIISLGRGACDTYPATHSAGDIIYFYQKKAAYDPTEYSEGSTVYMRLLPQTGVGTLPIADALTETVVMDGRQFRPTRPSNIKQNNISYAVVISGALTVSWGRSNRISQTIVNDPPYFFDGSDVSAEPDTIWRLYLYAENNLSPANLDTGYTTVIDNAIDVTSYLWNTEIVDSGLGRLNNTIRMRLKAIKTVDTVEIESKTFDWTFNRA